MQKKKIVLYSTNAKRRSSDSNCQVFPKWADLWDQLGEDHPETEIVLIVQTTGRYFLDIYDGELVQEPQKIRLVQMDMEANADDFMAAIEAERPDAVIAINGPISGRDWNGIRDAAIADRLKAKGIETYCYPLETAFDCFDKWRTHCFLKRNGFLVPEAVYLHEGLFSREDPASSTGNVYKETVLGQVKALPFPIIMKGTTGSASAGIVVAKTYEEAESYLLSGKVQEDLIIEEYLPGDDYTTEIHGCKGAFNVLPPYIEFTTDHKDVIDPFGLSTLKYGPIISDEMNTDGIVAELERMAELMELSGINNVDLKYSRGKWYIIEINSRWSGITMLTCGSEGRSPYEIYLSQVTGAAKDYRDLNNIKLACNFKIGAAGTQTLAELSTREHVTSVIQYELAHGEDAKYLFSDVVIAGFTTIEEMAAYLSDLQREFPEYIAENLADAMLEKSGAGR